MAEADALKTLYISAKEEKRLKACDLLKEAIKEESDAEYMYTKIKQNMPIDYIVYDIVFGMIIANRDRDKIKLLEIAKKIGCSI